MVRDSRYVTNTAYSGAESLVISRFRCTTQERNHYNDRDRLALHVADHALEAAPDDETVRERVAERYERRAERVWSSMASDIYRSAVAYAEAG